MKTQVTQKHVKSSNNCVMLYYCELPNLFKYNSAEYYTCGIYGWNADVFVNQSCHIAVVTGYRPFGARLPKNVMDELEKLDKEAENNRYTNTNEDLQKKAFSIIDNYFDNKSEKRAITA